MRLGLEVTGLEKADVVASLSELIGGNWAEPSDVPLQWLLALQQRASPSYSSTAFTEVQCNPGFKCVSKVQDFGIGHDGVYDKPPPANIPPRYTDSYEWGCPAMGVMKAGACEKPAEGADGGGGMCYSATRYESGPNTPCDADDKCFCMRPTSAKGNPGGGGTSSDNVNGEEIQTQSFLVQPAASCTDCQKFDCSKAQCDSCINCEYGGKDVELPDPHGGDGTYTRTQTGCFKVLNKEDVQANKYVYMKGKQTIPRDLKIIPHYKMWDPGEPPDDPASPDKFNFRMPYQSRREPLSRKGWIAKYKQAGPAMQKTMDILAMKMLDGTANSGAWAPKLNKESHERKMGLDLCWKKDAQGQDISGKLDKFLAAQKTCKRMQETALLVGANKEGFPSEAEKGCGAFADDPESSGRTCGCHRGDGKSAYVCKSLNCYTGNEDVEAAIKVMKEKMKTCSRAVIDAMPVGGGALPARRPKEEVTKPAAAVVEPAAVVDQGAAAVPDTLALVAATAKIIVDGAPQLNAVPLQPLELCRLRRHAALRSFLGGCRAHGRAACSRYDCL